MEFFGGGKEHSECNLYAFCALGPTNLKLPADFPIQEASYESVSAISLLTLCGSNPQVGYVPDSLGQTNVSQSIEHRSRSLFLLQILCKVH